MDIFKIKPEIISVHVPKTAGSTFHAVLINNYGLQLKQIQGQKYLHIWNNGLNYRCNRPFVKAIHGHIEAHVNWKDQYPDAKILAWVREPVERVISAYYHWKREIDHKDTHHELFVQSQPDLIEFTEMQEFSRTVNALQTYLGGLEATDFYFIGRSEYFNADIKILAGKLKWKRLNYKNRNVNLEKPQMKPDIREKLRMNLKNEYELYDKLLERNRVNRK